MIKFSDVEPGDVIIYEDDTKEFSFVSVILNKNEPMTKDSTLGIQVTDLHKIYATGTYKAEEKQWLWEHETLIKQNLGKIELDDVVSNFETKFPQYVL